MLVHQRVIGFRNILEWHSRTSRHRLRGPRREEACKIMQWKVNISHWPCLRRELFWTGTKGSIIWTKICEKPAASNHEDCQPLIIANPNNKQFPMLSPIRNGFAKKGPCFVKTPVDRRALRPDQGPGSRHANVHVHRAWMYSRYL